MGYAGNNFGEMKLLRDFEAIWTKFEKIVELLRWKFCVAFKRNLKKLKGNCSQNMNSIKISGKS